MKIPSLLGALLLTACAQKYVSQPNDTSIHSQHPIKTVLKIEHPQELRFKDGVQLQHVTGASGLVIVKNQLYVISDDASDLNHFDFPMKAAAQTIPLFSDELSDEVKTRKKQKADLEAMTLLDYPRGQQSLLLVPSGSKENRIRGALLPLNEKAKAKTVTLVDFSKLYQHLYQSNKKLNIEGIVTTPDQLLLLSRGNSKKSRDAVIALDRKCVLKGPALNFDPSCMQDIKYFEVGSWGTAPLAFTDAIWLDKQHLLFLAAAENTDDANDDGAILGSVLGKLNFVTGKIAWIRPLSEPVKAEGIAIKYQARQAQLYITSDPDDREKSSLIHEASLSLDELK